MINTSSHKFNSMKNVHIYFTLLLLLFTSINISGQCNGTFPSSHSSDQIVQGPCYAFATVAAIEAESGQNFDLSEWYFYSRCVLDGATGNGTIMVEQIIDQVNNVGALFQDDFYAPTAPCPFSPINNPQGAGTPCIFICENTISDFCNEESAAGCPLGMLENFNDEGFADCTYQDKAFSTHEPDKYMSGNFTATDLMLENETDKLKVIEDQICENGTGVVLFINDFSPNSDPIAPQHAIYVFKIQDSTLTFKDSWPGSPSVSRTMTLSPSNYAKAYVIQGSGSEVSCLPDPPECACEYLDGPACVDGPTKYTLVGNCTGDKIWSIPEGLEIVSGGNKKSRFVTIKSTSCEQDTLWIGVNVPNCGLIKKQVIVKPNLPQQPTEILVFAQDICPNQLIEVNVIDNNAPYPETTYEWSVLSGGTIVSGQGTPTIFVQTANIQFGILKIRVRAVNECGVSTWKSIGVPFSEDCRNGEGDGKDIGMRSADIESQITVYPNPAQDVLYINSAMEKVDIIIYSIEGKQLLSSTSKSIDISTLQNGIYLLKSNAEGQTSQLIKFIKN